MTSVNNPQPLATDPNFHGYKLVANDIDYSSCRVVVIADCALQAEKAGKEAVELMVKSALDIAKLVACCFDKETLDKSHFAWCGQSFVKIANGISPSNSINYSWITENETRYVPFTVSMLKYNENSKVASFFKAFKALQKEGNTQAALELLRKEAAALYTELGKNVDIEKLATKAEELFAKVKNFSKKDDETEEQAARRKQFLEVHDFNDLIFNPLYDAERDYHLKLCFNDIFGKFIATREKDGDKLTFIFIDRDRHTEEGVINSLKDHKFILLTRTKLEKADGKTS